MYILNAGGATEHRVVETAQGVWLKPSSSVKTLIRAYATYVIIILMVQSIYKRDFMKLAWGLTEW